MAPLFLPRGDEAAKRMVREWVPQAAHMKVERSATYLGVVLGPGAGDKGWEAPLLKMVDRAKGWGRAVQGTFYAIKAYNVYCVSILQFYLQCLPAELGGPDMRAEGGSASL